MSKSATVRARVDPQLKQRAEAMLDEMGLSATAAITLFYRQIIQRRALPFEVRLPNAATRRAMQTARSGLGIVAADSMDELLAELDAPKAARSAKRKARSARAAARRATWPGRQLRLDQEGNNDPAALSGSDRIAAVALVSEQAFAIAGGRASSELHSMVRPSTQASRPSSTVSSTRPQTGARR